METIKFDLAKKGDKFKILNATNGGPWYKRHALDQYRSNLAEYKAARIPYSRNHDSGVVPTYGGPYSHDINKIFPVFDADPYDPDSYDFACTDEEILKCLEAGTETYFRLGQTIEHQIKKHNILPPKDFKKWAVICEHIIRHYNEGWANGYNFNIEYWEIWNEPDMVNANGTSCTWGGSRELFLDFYEVAAKHLKGCFPHLKIGGPALSDSMSFGELFLKEMQKRNVPLDFFSWHIYTNDPSKMVYRANFLKELLIKYGYENAESHLNEWNYIKGWTEEFVYSLECMHGIKGAAFVMACICEAQKSNAVDMLMYYDTRPSTFNGAFDYYTARPLKGYYPLYWYGMFYDMTAEIKAENKLEDIYTLCGVDENEKALSIITYYTDNDDTAENKTVKLDFGKSGKYEVYLLDQEHTNELISTTDNLTFELKPNSCILIKEI